MGGRIKCCYMQRVENATLEAKVATCSAPVRSPLTCSTLPPKLCSTFPPPLWHHPVDVGKAFFIIVFENCRQDTDEGGHYRCAKLTNAACVSSVRVCVCVLWERQVTSHAHKYAPSFAQIASNFFVDCWHFFHTSSLRGRGGAWTILSHEKCIRRVIAATYCTSLPRHVACLLAACLLVNLCVI